MRFFTSDFFMNQNVLKYIGDISNFYESSRNIRNFMFITDVNNSNKPFKNTSKKFIPCVIDIGDHTLTWIFNDWQCC
jgi:hypothetical protein